MAADYCIVDSSVFVAFYRDIDSQHEDAMRVMRDISDSVLVVHPYVIQETATVLAYRCGMKIAKQFCADIADASNVIIPAVDSRYDMFRFKEVAKKISFTDAALVELAKTSGATIITFDKQIIVASRSAR